MAEVKPVRLRRETNDIKWCDRHTNPYLGSCEDCDQESEERMRPAIEATKKRIREAFRLANPTPSGGD